MKGKKMDLQNTNMRKNCKRWFRVLQKGWERRD